MELGYFSMPSHPPERGLKAGQDWDLQNVSAGWMNSGYTGKPGSAKHHTALRGSRIRRLIC